MKNTANNRTVQYFFGGNTVKDLCLQDEMEQFEKDLANFKFIPVVARPEPESQWQGQSGLVTEAVQQNFKDLAGYEGYLCGSPGMIDAAVNVFTSLGMKEENVYFDKFA